MASVNGDAARCDMWAGPMERCLASGVAVGERCSLSKVSESSPCRRLAVFCDEELGRFAGKSSGASGWAKPPRNGFAADPFTASDAVYISKRPQDMRFWIQRLASIVAADFGRDPVDGVLCCFVG